RNRSEAIEAGCVWAGRFVHPMSTIMAAGTTYFKKGTMDRRYRSFKLHTPILRFSSPAGRFGEVSGSDADNRDKARLTHSPSARVSSAASVGRGSDPHRELQSRRRRVRFSRPVKEACQRVRRRRRLTWWSPYLPQEARRAFFPTLQARDFRTRQRHPFVL